MGGGDEQVNKRMLGCGRIEMNQTHREEQREEIIGKMCRGMRGLG